MIQSYDRDTFGYPRDCSMQCKCRARSTGQNLIPLFRYFEYETRIPILIPVFQKQTFFSVNFEDSWSCDAQKKQIITLIRGPLMVAQWLRYCAANRKVAGSIPDGIIRIFSLT
jgi:hypothetical protein